jgi:Domain of unknown function (DUF4126)
MAFLSTIGMLLPSLLLGVALSASSGFRIFVPFLVSNLAARIGWISLSENFAWMTSNTTLIVLIIACTFEVGAYYIAFVDNFLDTLAIPASVVAGTLLTSQFLPVEDPLLQWGLGVLAGGGVAGTVQAGTSLLRLGSSKFTMGFGNGFFSSFENFLSLFLSFTAIWLPVFVGSVVLLFVIWLIRKLTLVSNN